MPNLTLAKFLVEPARSPAMSKKSRRHYTTEQKVALLKRHMVDKVDGGGVARHPLVIGRTSRRLRPG